MTHEELHEWARVNLLPHENAETQLRFAEGEEGYDEDYILEKYNENKRLNKDYIVGKNYRYSEIPEEDTDELVVTEYGLEYVGQNAIHIRYFKGEIDVWFIWDGQANEGIFKCVYNS